MTARNVYRPLPTGAHGLDREAVRLDQRERLRNALIELVAAKGYQAVRIADLAKLARVSQPTFYALFADKEELFVSAYGEIAERTARTVIDAYAGGGSQHERLLVAMRAYAALAAAEPDAMSLLVLGAFGAGGKALERRRNALSVLEASISASRGGVADGDLTVKAILGGIREVTATRLREGRPSELPELAGQLAAWASAYPQRLPRGLGVPIPASTRAGAAPAAVASERARRAEGRLPSGRSDLPRHEIERSQRERIVDATAAIAAEKGLAGLTVPEIASRANVSLQTFYGIYQSKRDAFLGAQKVGMHQALLITDEAYRAHAHDWPAAVAAGLRALLDYLSSEPAHAHLSIVDTFAASPAAIEIRGAALATFAAYLAPGHAQADADVAPITAEAIAGAIWQILHHYVEHDAVAELPAAAPQLVYLALTPFIGAARAGAAAAR